MGILSVPITNLFKKIPFINKFSGWIIPIINSLINVAIVYVLSLIFKISVFENPTDFQQVMTALGINVTVAQIFYEAIKPKTKV